MCAVSHGGRVLVGVCDSIMCNGADEYPWCETYQKEINLLTIVVNAWFAVHG